MILVVASLPPKEGKTTLNRDPYLVDADRMSTDSVDAAREHASTLCSVFEECARQLEDQTRSAAGHASDSLLYQQVHIPSALQWNQVRLRKRPN